VVASLSVRGTFAAPEAVTKVTDHVTFRTANEISHTDSTEGSFVDVAAGRPMPVEALLQRR
jgi:hypothetical protein